VCIVLDIDVAIYRFQINVSMLTFKVMPYIHEYKMLKCELPKILAFKKLKILAKNKCIYLPLFISVKTTSGSATNEGYIEKERSFRRRI